MMIATQRWQIAVIGAGPAGLALALMAARGLPNAEITLFDARPADKDVSADPRTLALALGSVQALQRLGAWPAGAAQPILEVLVSQAPPTVSLPDPLQRTDQRAVGQHRAQHRHRLVAGTVSSSGVKYAPCANDTPRHG